MKKILILVCGALLFATSCLPEGGSPGSSSRELNGTMVVKNVNLGEVTYTNENATITVTIPNILVAKTDITFNNVTFGGRMPQMTITIPNIPFTETVSADGSTINAVFDSADIIPTSGGVEYEKFKIKRVWGCIGKPLSVSFELANPDYPYMVEFSKSETTQE